MHNLSACRMATVCSIPCPVVLGNETLDLQAQPGGDSKAAPLQAGRDTLAESMQLHYVSRVRLLGPLNLVALKAFDITGPVVQGPARGAS